VLNAKMSKWTAKNKTWAKKTVAENTLLLAQKKYL